MKKHLIIFAFLLMLFSSKSAFSQIQYCYDWEVDGYGYSQILYNNQLLQVSGLAGTEIVVYDYTPYFCDHDFNAWVYSELANSGGVLSYGRLESESWEVEGRHPVFNAQYRTYCVTSAHGFVDYWTYDDGKILKFFTDEYTAVYTQDCHTFTPPPTPTPTPPCLDCQDIQATIEPFEIIEKYNVVNVPITVSNAVDSNGQPLTTTFSIRTSSGTGSATFEDGSTSVSFQGNITNQNLRIKGVTESSQVNNIIVEAKYNNRLLASDTFTVAAITALEFDRIDNTYSALDANPGTDGTVNPDGSEGQRIYPDKISVADVNVPIQVDRSLVKVTATVSPAVPNLTVYFASFDLDDPSANTAPIDTNGFNGNDNNGAVSSSLSGGFVNPTTGGTCSGATAGTTPNYISKISCTASATTVTTNFKVTMQPGDNFTVFANLTGAAIPDNFVNSGSSITTSSGGGIHISGQPNTDQTLGIRTNMLTVWRKLHIEVDSMGDATGNKVEGMMNENRKVGAGTKTVQVNVTPALEPNRFENGRMVIGGRGYPVVGVTATQDANTASEVTIRVNMSFNITTTTPFTLYDDDDMDDDDSGMLNGDEGDDVAEPNLDLLQPNDAACIVGAMGKITNLCNVFLPAYTVPKFDLSGSYENIAFSTNSSDGDIINIYNNHFNQRTTESNSDFWTIYLVGGYQWNTTDDADPGLNAATRRGDSFVFGKVDALNGIGVTIFTELNRAAEYENINVYNSVINPSIADWQNRPVARKYTLAHEVGHLFGGYHEDTGLMSGSTDRTDGIFRDITINKIRGGIFTDYNNQQTRITHP